MIYALVLEQDSALCNDTSRVISSMGYMITPVFNPKKALHAAHMIQFDLIVTCTAINPGDRRSLTGELKRCSPDSVVVLLADSELASHTDAAYEGVSAVLHRPLSALDLKRVVNSRDNTVEVLPPPQQAQSERRRRAID